MQRKGSIGDLKRSLRVASAQVGARIRQLREDKKLSQRELAKALHIARGAVSQWEGDLTQPSLGQIEHLAVLLDSTPEFISFNIGSSNGGEQGKVRRYRMQRALAGIMADATQPAAKRASAPEHARA